MTCAKIGASNSTLHRCIKVRIVQHNQRIFTAHLQLHASHIINGIARNMTAYANGTRKGNGLNIWRGTEGFAHISTRAHHQIKHTSGQTAAANNISQYPSTAGHQLSWFEHHCIAVGYGRCHFPGRNRHGEIPRSDNTNHTQCLPVDFYIYPRANGLRILTHQAQHFGTIVLKELPGSIDFANTFCPGFAFFSSQNFTNFTTAGNKLGTNKIQHSLALLQSTLRPALKGCVGRADSVQTVCIGCLGIMTDDIASI